MYICSKEKIKLYGGKTMIRLISKSDFEDIRALTDQVHTIHVKNRPDIYKEGNHFGEELFEKILNDSSVIATVYDDGKVKGFCYMTIQNIENQASMVDRKKGFIETIVVDEEFRNQGIGKELFLDIKSRAIKTGIKCIELMIWSFNSFALSFYKSLGMTPRSEILEIKLIDE